MATSLKRLLPLLDRALWPLVYPSAALLKAVRRVGLHRLPMCRKALLHVGVLPIRRHYYEPLFDERLLSRPLSAERDLPGIDWNVEEQLSLLTSFAFADELKSIPSHRTGDMEFYMENGSFGSGDAEYLYSIIRWTKPRTIVEIGSGNSTLMAARAIEKNKQEDRNYACRHICIEPYEMPWLERLGVQVLRQKVEDTDAAIFSGLENGDLLFIDSSHIIRPQGDVLCEYLELLPRLRPGVIVHVHDIFSPRDYLEEWVKDRICLWNEQYLLEAFLTCNRDWRIIGALNYLHHHHYETLSARCPHLTRAREPGSFYIRKAA